MFIPPWHTLYCFYLGKRKTYVHTYMYIYERENVCVWVCACMCLFLCVVSVFVCIFACVLLLGVMLWCCLIFQDSSELCFQGKGSEREAQSGQITAPNGQWSVHGLCFPWSFVAEAPFLGGAAASAGIMQPSFIFPRPPSFPSCTGFLLLLSSCRRMWAGRTGTRPSGEANG